MRSLRRASFFSVERGNTSSAPYATCASSVFAAMSMEVIFATADSYNKFYFHDHPIYSAYESRPDALLPCGGAHRELHRRIAPAEHQPANHHDPGEGARGGLRRRALLPPGTRRAAHR